MGRHSKRGADGVLADADISGRTDANGGCSPRRRISRKRTMFSACSRTASNPQPGAGRWSKGSSGHTDAPHAEQKRSQRRSLRPRTGALVWHGATTASRRGKSD
eukprot:1574112-Alexandrium_andersonii.AAC.1